HLEADHAIEEAIWLLGKARNERVVGLHFGESCLKKELGQRAVASAVIENARGPGLGKQPSDQGGVQLRSRLLIVGVNQRIFIVVDVPLEILLREMVECGGEDEPALRATMVVDGYTGDVECILPVDLTVLVEIEET